jgi:murein DD-endopeptidase MepM/ murein hydrolase activator NlpD
LAARRSKFACALLALALAMPVMSPSAWAVNEKQLREARDRYRQVQSQLNRIAEQYAKEQRRLDNIQAQINTTSKAIKKSSDETIVLQAHLRDRVRTAYRLGGVGFFDFLLSSASFRDFTTRAVVLERQASEDEDVILRLRRARADLASRRAALRGQSRAQAEVLSGLRTKASELDAAFGTAQSLLSRLEDQRLAEELARRTRGLAGVIGRVFALARCPSSGPHAFSNDWGAPRGGGRRRHRGNDIFAPMGSPAVAPVPGVVSRESSGGNAGLGLYFWGDDRNEYFYAHMSGFAVPTGTRASAGQTIAYVGNTGNARGGPPHIHFEIHPGGRAPVNPYPSLVRVC